MSQQSSNLSLSQSNAQFLSAIFPREDWRNLHVTGFTCPPEESGRAHWTGKLAATAWQRGELERYDANQYFTVSTFRPIEGDIPRRRKSNFIAQHVVVLDDLGSGAGSKSSMELLRGRPSPSWIMATSEGNTQVGYILSHSVDDYELMSRFDDAMVKQGMCSEKDNGQKGVTRYMRMFGTNNKRKYGAPFQTRLTWWVPTQQYSLVQLVEGWGLELAPRRSHRAVTPVAAGKDVVHKVLEAEGLYGDNQDEGFIGCPCPFHEAGDLHTDDDGRHGYNPEIQGFQCFHGHEPTRNDLRQYLQDTYPDTYRQAEIQIAFGAAPELTEQQAGEREAANAAYLERLRIADEARMKPAPTDIHGLLGGMI